MLKNLLVDGIPDELLRVTGRCKIKKAEKEILSRRETEELRAIDLVYCILAINLWQEDQKKRYECNKRGSIKS